ncbi:hypothetical protein Snas_1605 [Stackebrandtia nassauensis DSM 44728]|uniref:ATP/GTP-binding protein n=1 Tax=Stackebrandtia nassauensis (strain DSM 44728 / CIP 108903 / NRRL B-16338 / NBRC 102104 / LLR-40K-21) TaxID=446470 RepID=D3PWF1_STANL|nr:hypothetical protein Snas_1605 [Stackebrandtia nassauensis DSM 44728]
MLAGVQAVEDGPDGRWHVRNLPGGGSAKTYRCPGCDQEIPPGVPHLVAWPADGSTEERRHWHRPCWRARYRRGPSNSRRR